MRKFTIKSLKDTEKLAEKVAGQLRGGEVIGFIGNLGAGKTTFIQYLAKALGVKNTVNSPTFNIMKTYPLKSLPLAKGGAGGGQFVHIDAYRLNSAEELKALGAEEYLDNYKTVAVIEWADKVKSILPQDALIINIKLNKNGTRIFRIK